MYKCCLLCVFYFYAYFWYMLYIEGLTSSQVSVRWPNFSLKLKLAVFCAHLKCRRFSPNMFMPQTL